MQAWRNIAGNIQQVYVDVGPDGKPLLPPDTTVDPKPDPQPGHYVTVVGNSWVQIPIPVPYFEFSYLKQQALDKFFKYKTWYLSQPVTIDGSPFDNDDVARNRMIQALVIYSQTNYLPSAWVDANNVPHPVAVIADLQKIMTAMSQDFSTKFFEMETIRQQILATTDEAGLNAITIPAIPLNV